ncbi:MAG: formate dehydrogenase accessory protein FdhE [Acidobacteria bacterium]|nr:formate dehydrogenase accessory protein FdhE [Acidobacteriota bacterium]
MSNGRRPDFPETHLFFGRALRQAYAANLAEKILAKETRTAVCPVCGSVPVAAMLREEAQGAKRSFVCSLCLSIWEYKRIVCPACSEEEFEKLPTFRAEQFQHLLVEACDTCRKYITTVDCTKDGLAIAEVDELAALPLNLWASENGYTKVQANLLGM